MRELRAPASGNAARRGEVREAGALRRRGGEREPEPQARAAARGEASRARPAAVRHAGRRHRQVGRPRDVVRGGARPEGPGGVHGGGRGAGCGAGDTEGAVTKYERMNV